MVDMVSDAYVTIEVSNVARAVKFYTKVLGLKLVKKYDEYWADIKAPGLWIGLHLDHEDGPKKKSSGNMSIGFTARDIDKAATALQKKGIKIKVEDLEWGRYAGFKDPDGTELYFWESA